MRDHQTIPQHEPEVVEAKARRFVDADKAATTSLESIVMHGVKLVSRYRKAHELELMRGFVLDLPAAVRGSVASIFCDSKATYFFTVVVRDWSDAEIVGRALAASALARNGGHNGITVCARDRKNLDSIFGGQTLVDVDPDWRDDIIGIWDDQR